MGAWMIFRPDSPTPLRGGVICRDVCQARSSARIYRSNASAVSSQGFVLSTLLGFSQPHPPGRCRGGGGRARSSSAHPPQSRRGAQASFLHQWYTPNKSSRSGCALNSTAHLVSAAASRPLIEVECHGGALVNAPARGGRGCVRSGCLGPAAHRRGPDEVRDPSSVLSVSPSVLTSAPEP